MTTEEQLISLGPWQYYGLVTDGQLTYLDPSQSYHWLGMEVRRP